MYIKKNAMQRPLLRAFPLLLGEERERSGDEGGSVMNGRIYFEDFKTRGDATRGKSDVTENFTFLTFVYIYIYLILDLCLFIFLGQDFYRGGENFLKYLSNAFLNLTERKGRNGRGNLTIRRSLEKCLETPDPDCLGLLYF